MQKLSNLQVRKAREAGREILSTFTANKKQDTAIRNAKLAELNVANVESADGNKSLVEQFQRFHDAVWNDSVPNSGYVNEYLSARERGRAIMAAGRKGERNFPPARQVVKP